MQGRWVRRTNLCVMCDFFSFHVCVSTSYIFLAVPASIACNYNYGTAGRLETCKRIETGTLTFGQTNIQYEGLMNIKYGESSTYFSFDEKIYQCFQSFKTDSIRFPYSMKAAHLLSLHVGGAIADVFVSPYILHTACFILKNCNR